ncbi:MAG: diguanylate cyclase [Caulobacteraceae bacterium]
MECPLKNHKECEYVKSTKAELDSYQKCVERSLQEISALNVKYEHTVNELSTIINIFEYINMMTDYKNLFSIINDMLIGVLGATSSTIFMNDDGRYNVEASSISRQMVKGMETLGKVLLDVYGDQKETFILKESDIKDGLSKSRGIKSAVAVPLIGKEKLAEVIYLEHEKRDYFAPEIKKYLNTLAVAIRLFLENAQLYSRLEEMALRDGLTGLYNRMFFNKEITNCMDNYRKYSLPFVLAILDIDHFKKVNENY